MGEGEGGGFEGRTRQVREGKGRGGKGNRVGFAE